MLKTFVDLRKTCATCGTTRYGPILDARKYKTVPVHQPGFVANNDDGIDRSIDRSMDPWNEANNYLNDNDNNNNRPTDKIKGGNDYCE